MNYVAVILMYISDVIMQSQEDILDTMMLSLHHYTFVPMNIVKLHLATHHNGYRQVAE